jgi:hypothetical protein
VVGRLFRERRDLLVQFGLVGERLLEGEQGASKVRWSGARSNCWARIQVQWRCVQFFPVT